jgi:hypothetical protein
MEETIDISKPRRRYYRDKFSIILCPECNDKLIKHSCSIIIYAKSSTDEIEITTNMSGSHFCKKCPVVVFDTNKLEEVTNITFNCDENISYQVVGIIDQNDIPVELRLFEEYIDKSNVPVVGFLPDLNFETTYSNNYFLSNKLI